MTNKTILDLPVAISLAGSEPIEIVQGGTSKRATVNQVGRVAIGNPITASIQVVANFGANPIPAGVLEYMRIPFDATITSATILAGTSGSISIDIWKCTYAQFDAGSTHPVSGDSICGGNPITVTSTFKGSSSLNNWTTNLSDGDVLAFNVMSQATSITSATVILGLTRVIT